MVHRMFLQIYFDQRNSQMLYLNLHPHMRMFLIRMVYQQLVEPFLFLYQQLLLCLIVCLVGNVVSGLRDKGLGDADAGAAVFDGFVTKLLDIFPCGCGAEAGVVNVTQNFFYIHGICYPFRKYAFTLSLAC